jgi:hypothetical protein
MVLMAAVVVTTRAAAVRVTILAAVLVSVFPAILSAILASVLAARGLIGLAGHDDRGQQRAGDEQSRAQLCQSSHCQLLNMQHEGAPAGWPPL